MSGATSPNSADARSTAGRATGPVKPFYGLLDSIIVEDPVWIPFDGALSREQAVSIWTWIKRDVAPDLIDANLADTDPSAPALLDPAMPPILVRVREAVAHAATSGDGDRRIRAQVGGDEAFMRLPFVLGALKSRGLLEKAKAFGRALNAIQDDATLAAAMQSMPLSDTNAATLLMQAAVGYVQAPHRLVVGVIKITGDATEGAVRRAGFAPLIEALLAHAQNQIHSLAPMGAYADIDLTCRALDRFHRLVRAVSGYIEVDRLGRWAQIIATLTKRVSERIEPKLREVSVDVNQSLRRPRDGVDRLDSDRLLSALNGIYLLSTIRDCRDSLALNALFDQTWNQVGEALEMHINRNLDVLRADPTDKVAAARTDAAIKMAELRFNTEYADVLRRAAETARRPAS